MQNAPVSENLGGIISTKEARKLLGKSYEYLTDDDVEAMIVGMTTLASSLIDWQNGSTKPHGEVV